MYKVKDIVLAVVAMAVTKIKISNIAFKSRFEYYIVVYYRVSKNSHNVVFSSNC